MSYSSTYITSILLYHIIQAYYVLSTVSVSIYAIAASQRNSKPYIYT